MKISIFGGVLIAALAVASFAQAQTNTPSINKRQRSQENRITNGAQSGDLTVAERQHLRDEERQIRDEKRAARADGHVSYAEKRQIGRDEKRLSDEIYRLKHNHRVRQ
jgi:hypothetical protein